MSREEAIEIFKRLKENAPNEMHLETIGTAQELLDMAIQSLSQEPTDVVSRGAFEQVMRAFDIAVGQLKELGYGLGQKIEPCDDAIDREYLFKVLDDFCGHDRTATITLDTLADLVYDMPSVTQKSGKWKYVPDADGFYICSECGCGNDYADNFCPQCGARMVEPQESEASE